MADQDPVAVVHEYFTACNAHDVEWVKRCHAEAAVNYDSCRPESPVRGREAIGALWTRVFRNLPDIRWREDQIFGKGDQVVVEWTLWATFPKGPVSASGADLYEVRDGLIQNVRQYWDASAFRLHGGLKPADAIDWSRDMEKPALPYPPAE